MGLEKGTEFAVAYIDGPSEIYYFRDIQFIIEEFISDVIIDG